MLQFNKADLVRKLESDVLHHQPTQLQQTPASDYTCLTGPYIGLIDLGDSPTMKRDREREKNA